MSTIIVVVVAVLALVGLALSVRVVQQYEEGVLFRLGRVVGVREPGLTLIVPLVEVLRRVSLRIVTMPIQSQASSPTTTSASTSPPSPTTGSPMRSSRWSRSRTWPRPSTRSPRHPAQGGRPAHPGPDPGRDRPDQCGHPRDPGPPDRGLGVVVTLVELKDIQLPETMQRAWPARPRPNGRSGPRSSPRGRAAGRRPARGGRRRELDRPEIAESLPLGATRLSPASTADRSGADP
jgi:SPFH domain / Band 7 family